MMFLMEWYIYQVKSLFLNIFKLKFFYINSKKLYSFDQNSLSKNLLNPVYLIVKTLMLNLFSQTN